MTLIYQLAIRSVTTQASMIAAMTLYIHITPCFIPIDIELKISRHNADDQLLRPSKFYYNRIMNTASTADILTNGDINRLCKTLRVAPNDIA